MKETLEDTLNGVLDGMSISKTIGAWNEYCNQANYMDDYIYRNNPDFFIDNYAKESVWDLIRHISNGNYNSNHDYMVYSKHTGNLNSFDYLCDDYCPYDQSALVGWLIRTYGDDLESIGEFLGEDIEVAEDDTIYTVGDKTYQFIADDDLVCSCNKCCFHQGKSCGASDLYDAGILPQCDGDGMGYNGYWVEVKDAE